MFNHEKKSVLVLYAGGTIGMKENNDNVYIPKPGMFLDRLRGIPQLHDADLALNLNLAVNQLVLPRTEIVVLYELREYDPLLDSSNMTTTDWIKLANDIETNYDKFDGFIILQGTDTLAYTSSALSFMITGLRKNVIVTGALISIFEPRSDAVDNILLSLILCTYDIPEVCVVFGKKIMRGNRTIKLRVEEFEAFDSPNCAALGETGVNITIYKNRIRKPESEMFSINTNLNTNVGLLTFFPTITASLIGNFLHSLNGVVIQTYGSGNISSNRKEIVEVLKRAVVEGVLIVNITMCVKGSVNSIYETGKVLDDIGVVNGYDMTPEAALTKMSVVLGYSGLSYEERVQFMKTDMRGELTSSKISN